MGTKDVLYVLPAFPKVSETFIINEVSFLRANCIGVLPVSIDSADALEDTIHEKATGLRRDTEYVNDRSTTAFVRDALGFLVDRPRALLEVSRLNWRLGALPSVSRLGRLHKGIEVARIAVKRDVDHIHGHWTLPSNTALLASLLADRSFSFTFHAHDIYDELPEMIAETDFPTLRYKVDRSEFIVTCTARNKKYLVDEYGLPPTKLHHIYHGVDTEEFRPASTADTAADRTHLLAIGRLVEYKGFDNVVGASAELRDRGFGFECTIVGDGPQYDSLVEQVREHNLEETVSLPGYLPHEEVRELYSEATVFVFAGAADEGHYGLPNVLVEAAAMGVPIVTTGLPAVPELVTDGTSGLVLADSDPGTIADAVERVLVDDDLRESFVTNSRKTVEEKFAIDETLDPLVELFERHA